MRWPLRNQILLPMVGVTLAAIIGVSLFNAYLSAQRTRERIDRDLAGVADTLANSAFPLTDAVLRQMRGLSGADFVLSDSAGEQVLNSSALGEFPASPPQPSLPSASPLALGAPILIGDRAYFYTSVEVRRANERTPRPTTLHIYYPQSTYEQAWRDVVQPPLIVAALTMVLVVGISFGIASRVTRPLVQLQGQVGEIAAGEFRSMPIPNRNDEVADLSRAVNRMAETLTQYEQQVRRHEQLRTLGQLGGGIAHQMRNSVTGCKMALELHERECPARGKEESLSVARRQLSLMETYLQRFLALGKATDSAHERIDMKAVVENALTLIQPTARHLKVEIVTELPDKPVEISGDAGALEQVLVNIILNGVEAAAAAQDGTAGQESLVHIALQAESDKVRLEVSDTGAGPAASVQEKLFEPFVTEKPDGVGLGLSVAQETIQAHGGAIGWQRSDGATCFQIDLPLATANNDQSQTYETSPRDAELH